MKQRKIEKIITLKEYEIEENGSWKQIGEKTTSETVEFNGTYLEDELMKQQSKYTNKWISK